MLFRSLAHMIVCGQKIDQGYLAAELAALLEERDISARSAGADLQERVRILRSAGHQRGLDAARLNAVAKSVSRLADGLKRPNEMPGDTTVGRLIAMAYPDRIALKRPGDAPGINSATVGVPC